jgi:hypothetical protein
MSPFHQQINVPVLYYPVWAVPVAEYTDQAAAFQVHQIRDINGPLSSGIVFAFLKTIGLIIWDCPLAGFSKFPGVTHPLKQEIGLDQYRERDFFIFSSESLCP